MARPESLLGTRFGSHAMICGCDRETFEYIYFSFHLGTWNKNMGYALASFLLYFIYLRIEPFALHRWLGLADVAGLICHEGDRFRQEVLSL